MVMLSVIMLSVVAPFLLVNRVRDNENGSNEKKISSKKIGAATFRRLDIQSNAGLKRPNSRMGEMEKSVQENDKI
jgi:hypothetical protein